jgi:ribokinase
MERTAQIYVVGSINMDYVVEVERLPQLGETLSGSPLRLFAGGKGANQAVAAARLAATTETQTAFAGHIGDDEAGRILAASLKDAGVRCQDLVPVEGSSGSAMILRDSAGQNAIVVSPAANFTWTLEKREGLQAGVKGAKVLLLQMEIPLAVNKQAAQWAHAGGAMCILDPAPAHGLPPEFLASVDLLTPNESEACILLGEPVREIADAEVPLLAERLLIAGARAVLLKLGARGAYYRSAEEQRWCAPFRVQAADTTAAGDTFNGALAVALCEGRSMAESMRFANAAAACSVTREGAQNSIPSRKEVEDFLRLHEAGHTNG